MRSLLVLGGLFLLAILPASPARAQNVDVALAMVSDVSRSIDDTEFAMEKTGTSVAFADPRVLAAIHGGAVGSIAVTYIEFAGANEVRTVVGWTVIHDEASARSFTDAVSGAPRSFWGRTAISSGIEAAMQALASSGLTAQRKVIDVAGDGTNNAGREVGQSRDDAVAAGITINGLAIINEHPVNWSFSHVQPPGGLDNYYRDSVTGGPSSFVLAIHDFHDFGEALTRKLVNEIADLGNPAKFN
jgi:hypothetical protein